MKPGLKASKPNPKTALSQGFKMSEWQCIILYIKAWLLKQDNYLKFMFKAGSDVYFGINVENYLSVKTTLQLSVSSTEECCYFQHGQHKYRTTYHCQDRWYNRFRWVYCWARALLLLQLKWSIFGAGHTKLCSLLLELSNKVLSASSWELFSHDRRHWHKARSK